MKKIACMVFAMTLSVSSMVPVPAEELETDIPTAGATGLVGGYVDANGSDKNISGMLPAYQTSPTDGENVNVNMNSKMSKVFSDIAIAKVEGGEDGYVNVRKKPNENSKVKGKIYNNCGAIILGQSNGWYKIKSGNCRGYCKASFFKTGDDAINFCLDEGYVFATVKENGVHLRSKSSSDSSVVTNVFKGDCKSMKKYSKDGRWVKLRVSEGKNGWVSSDFVKVSVDFDQAKTIAEEKAEIAAQKAREEAEARAAAEAAAAEAAENNNGGGNNGGGNNGGGNVSNGNSNNGGGNNYSNGNSSRRRSNSSSYGYSKPKRRSYSGGGSSGGGRGGSIVSYAKNFLGNPYVFGGSSLTHGTDCSGFTMSVYAHFGISLNRSSYTQVNNGRAVSMSNLNAGDLLFYRYGGGRISHVAIYMGGGQIIHASNERTGITISGMGSPCAARRIIG